MKKQTIELRFLLNRFFKWAKISFELTPIITWLKSLLCLFLVATILSGCTSNIYIKKDKLLKSEYHYPHTVYLENTDSAYLSKLVVDSGVFSFSDNRHSDYHLKLLSDDMADFRCGVFGTAKLAFSIFLGLLPFFDSEEYKFFYEITHEGKTTRFSYKVPLYSRESIWEWLFKPFSSTKDELIIENLKYLAPEKLEVEFKK